MADVSTAPALSGVLETALYVDDLPRAREFYAGVLGLRAMSGDDRLVAFAVAPAQVLLLFRHGATGKRVELPSGAIPGHDGHGPVHFAFAIAADALPRWEAWLAHCGVAIEARNAWPRGGHSLYFRDPDQHLVELATPGLWENY